MRRSPSNRSSRRRGPLVIGVVLAIALFASACGGRSRSAPPVELPVNAQPSEIYASDGTLLTTLREENRVNVSLEQIPQSLQDAVVAIEDARFWEHNGVDPRAIARAATKNAEAGEVTEGGSTITQQYVKTALLSPEQTLGRKLEEATTALALERNYSKQLILELYLNTIYLGSGAYGVAAAAQEYFGVPVEQLTLDQSALLAGVIQSPSRNDPRSSPEAAVQRRNLVLQRMQEQSFITPAQAEAALAVPLALAEQPPRPEQLPYPAPHFVDEVKNWLLRGSDVLGETLAERREMLVRGGLEIETTVDLELQRTAEESIAEVLAGQGLDPRTPDAALVSIEPRTGMVKAMVGGHDYFGAHSYRQTNLAVGTGRSTGSAFKPIVMATALEAGVSPGKVFDSPASGSFRIPGGIWRVRGGGGLGAGTMAQCTVVSSNTCYANIMLDDQVGPARTVEMSKKLGITHTEVTADPAAVLGSNNVTVQDMASVYATFANDGLRVPPVLVTKITGPDGSVIYQHDHSQSRAVSSATVAQITPALEGVITGGTGTSADIGRPAAGKTGSAQQNTDAWFCGFTPQLSTAVWVGFAEPRDTGSGSRQLVSMSRPNTRITVYGGTYPAQIWSRFMRSALQATPATPLLDPVAATPTTTTVVPEPNAEFLAPAERDASVTVPDFQGMSLSEATADARRLGLRVERLDVASATARPGVVIGQSPAADSSVGSGTVVWLESTVAAPTTTTAAPTTTTTATAAPSTTTAPATRGG